MTIILKAVDPRPYRTGAGAPAAPNTAWQRADAVATRKRRIPPPVDGDDQRARIAEIARLRDAMDRTTDAAKKAALGEQATLLALQALHYEELAKAGNGGDITAAGEYAGVNGAGDLGALHSAMGAGRVNPKYVSGPLPNDVADDVAEAAKAEAKLATTTDPLEKERLGYEITLRKLRAFHAATMGQAPRSVTKSAAIDVKPLEKQLKKLDGALAKSTEPTTKAQLEELRRAVSGQILLAKLRALHS